MVLETLPPLPPPAPSLMRPKEEESIVPHQPVLLPAIKLNRTHSLPQNLKMILIPSTTALNQPKSSTITLQNQTHYSIYTIAPEETSSLPTPSSFLLDGWTEKEEETAQVSQILRRPIDKVDANGKTAENDQRADGAGADEFGGDSEAEDEEEGTKYQSDERGKDEQCLPAIHASSRRKEEEDAEETTAVRSEQAGSSFDATDSTLHATAAPAHATTQRTATGDVADWTERDCVAPPATHIHILHHSAVDTSTICVSSLETNITLAKSECWERSRPIPNHVTPPLPHQHSIHARSPSLLHLPPLSRVNTRHPSDIQPDSLSSRNSCIVRQKPGLRQKPVVFRPEEVSKIIVKQEYLSIPNRVARGLKLYEDEHVKLETLAESNLGSPSQLRRGRRALKDGREVGINGRPRFFSSAEETDLEMKVLEDISRNVPIKVSRVMTHVCFFFS
ncbi:hypothetical protein BLNAU_2003 [Blattamonas nauphoetae]|uniref:Uncharacterized protein n=1 Tax=Blattamonas nauphoetae TaxID=2049346 RepID=A0ABQ9YGU4_9EUKA|nr:hypothetical protein BLNAU_2003 [Blattamonas nauphoetae]